MKIISFGVLFAGILLIRRIAWKYISRRTQYFIWLFAAFFLLLCPFLNISSKFSLENVMYFTIQAIEKNGIDDVLNNQDDRLEVASEKSLSLSEIDNIYQSANSNIEVYEEITLPEQNAKDNNELNNSLHVSVERYKNVLQERFHYIYMGISATILIIITIFNIRFSIKCRKNRVFHKKLEEENLNIYLLKGISSPFLFGRNIYVDTDVIQNDKTLHHIIIHEYCHFRHKDNLWAIIRNLCLVLNWYNPFVWLANDYVKRDCELACDEAALSFLDDKEKMEYGYTLLKMVRVSKGKKQYSSIATTMSSNMKKMKERIDMIHSIKKNYVFVTWIVGISMVFLTGCTFTQSSSLTTSINNSSAIKEAYAEDGNAVIMEESVQRGTSKTGDSSSIADNPGKYYNVSATYYKGKTYLATADGLYSIADGSDARELIYGHSVTLGTLAEGYLFFYSYPEDINDAAIMSLDLSTNKVSASQILGEKIYTFGDMYYEDNCLYINRVLDTQIIAFTIQAEGILKEKETLSVMIPDDLSDMEADIHVVSPIISRGEGYSGTFYSAKDEGEEYYNRLYFYEDNAQMNKLEGITDVMITSKGVIGRDIDQYKDIYMWNIYTGEKRQLYTAKENEDLYFGYNTYDGQGLYGLLKEGDNNFYISRVNWDGSLDKLFLLENITDLQYGINVQMSVIHDWIYYFNPQNGKMERRNLSNI